jgi:electron transfer flavoprotein alpha subunit
MSSILFLVDHSGGKISKAAAELATFAKTAGESVAVVLSSNSAEIITQLSAFGVDRVITASGDWEKYSAGAAAEALLQIMESEKPAAVLITSSARGKEIAGRLAVKSKSGIITDAINIDKDLIATQSVFGGSTTVHSAVITGTPIITLRSNSIEAVAVASTPAVSEFAVAISDNAKVAGQS